MPTMNRLQQLSHKAVFISCIVPVYNEQENITPFVTQLHLLLSQLANRFEIIMIDDGSQDQTLTKIAELTVSLTHIKALAFSRNFGKEIALAAGLEHTAGDIAILIDADFQHPISVIPTMLEHWVQGYEMVYGVRSNRDNETIFKRSFANLFYKLMAKITKVHIPNNAGDFRLLDRKVVNAMNTLQERDRFMKGLYAWVGFKSIGIPFAVQERAAGKSTWKFTRLTELAITGITSFSNMPLRVWSVIGLSISVIALIYALFIVLKTLIYGIDIPGFASLVVGIMFFGGIQLLSIGILGEYIAQIFNEVKQRPKYIIAKKYGFD